ncbi:hypothetical protein [Aquimarina agarivorans]|uniref:hypothetical protein n=1 Tax=Aquimarina agarivorans TaxID=980584 RepID=UPI001EE65459|nr:hypothetical protein [Aquimarina agarivorans]
MLSHHLNNTNQLLAKTANEQRIYFESNDNLNTSIETPELISNFRSKPSLINSVIINGQLKGLDDVSVTEILFEEDSIEGNDTFDTAQVLSFKENSNLIQSTNDGIIGDGPTFLGFEDGHSDFDFYEITLEEDASIEISLESTAIIPDEALEGFPVFFIVSLENEEILFESPLIDSEFSYIFTPEEAGTFYIVVSDEGALPEFEDLISPPDERLLLEGYSTYKLQI